MEPKAELKGGIENAGFGFRKSTDAMFEDAAVNILQKLL